jgi:hypothetical protein
MNVKWMEPPAWWVKWKPLRWVLAIVVLYWFFGTLMPRLREDPPLPAVPVAVESESVADATDAPAQTASIAAVPTTPLPTKPGKPASAPPKPVVTEDEKPAEAAPTPTPAPVPAKKTDAASSAAAESAAPTTAEQDAVEEPDPAAPYTAVETTRVELINGLRSYESLESIQATLAQGNFASELSTINKDTQGGRYPPYRSDTLVIAKYQHAGIEGRLTLEFFNDRLYQSHFAPQQPTEYLRWLRAHGTPLPIKRTGRSSLTRGDLEVTTNIDFAVTEVGSLMGTKPYVQWTDTRLSIQMRNWGPIP